MNSQFFSRSIRAIAISTLVCGVAFLTACDKKEIAALTAKNKEQSEMISAKDKQIEILTSKNREQSEKLNQLEILAKNQINKEKEEIQVWNDTISQILVIDDQMMSYKMPQLLSRFNAGDSMGVLDEVEKSKRYYLNLSREAKSLAYKLPDTEPRKELLKCIDSLVTNLGVLSMDEAVWTACFSAKGPDDPETKKYSEARKSSYDKLFNNNQKIWNLKK